MSRRRQQPPLIVMQTKHWVYAAAICLTYLAVRFHVAELPLN